MPLRLQAVKVVLVLFLSLTFQRAKAADWPPVTPAELAVTSVPEHPGAPAVVLLREEIDDDLQHYHSIYMRIKILTEAGRKYADVEIPYNRQMWKLGEVSGRTVHADGSVVPFEGKAFDKVIVKGHGLRRHVKSFTLPDVQSGSIVEYRFVYRYGDRTAVAPRWIVQSDLFQKKVSFKFTPYERDLILEHDRIGHGVAWTSFMPKDKQPQFKETVKSRWVELQAENVPPLIEEPFMPPTNMLRWRVHFFYRVALKQDEFWRDEAKYWNKDVESFLHKDRGIAEAVAQTIGASQSPLQKVQKLYAFVSQLENRSYIPERTEQEEYILKLEENKGAEDVLRQRSGYHDDLNRLFVAMVRAAGLPASLMRVGSREDVFFDPAFMSTEQFDGEVAIVQLDGKDVFLDPGTKYCPYALLNWRYTNSKGLRQGAKGAEFAETPLPSYNQARTERVARVKLLDDGTVEGTVILAFYGLEAMNRRQEGMKTDEEGRKKMLEDEMRGWLPGGADVTLTKTPAWDKTEQPLVAEFKIASPLAVSGGKRWLLASHIFQVNQNAIFASAQRVNPVYFIYPTREIDEVHITLPPNAEVESLPAADTVKLDYAVYRSEHKRESANTVFAVRDLVMGGLAFPVGAYKELKGFYDKVKADDDQQVILKASQNVAAN